MSNQYHEVHELAERLHDKIGDLLDDKSHHYAKHLLHEAHQLTQLIKLQKKPRSIEDLVKSIVGTLESIRRDGDTIMDFRHTDMFISEYRTIQMELRKFPNY